jgi:hypothetical protein
LSDYTNDEAEAKKDQHLHEYDDEPLFGQSREDFGNLGKSQPVHIGPILPSLPVLLMKTVFPADLVARTTDSNANGAAGVD